MFDRLALITGKKSAVSDPEEDAIEVGADSVEKNDDGSFSFYGAPNEVESIRSALLSRGWEISVAERTYVAKNQTDLTEEQRTEIQALLEDLDDNDDSHRIHATV